MYICIHSVYAGAHKKGNPFERQPLFGYGVVPWTWVSVYLHVGVRLERAFSANSLP